MVIHWHRRDLRPADNLGLDRARSVDEPIVGLFVLDPAVLEHSSPVRTACLLEGLSALRAWYRDRGSDLLVRRGTPSDVLTTVATETGSSTVVWNADYSGLAQRRDAAVRSALEGDGIEVETVHDGLLSEPGSITTNAGEHYSVFSYFWKKWRDREKRDPVDPPAAKALATESIEGCRSERPSITDLGVDPPEANRPTVTPEGARDRVASFCGGPIYRYETDREYPARSATSRLSVHLKWGTIGLRELYAATERAATDAPNEAARENVSAFQRQLAFREFYAHVLAFNPETVSENFTDYPNEIEWRDERAELEAWQRGRTGYPIVDAGMRQLRTEAWMHNRVRMLVASFLTKDLLIDWRRGYEWFRRHLADHDTANDVGGWQWAASTGTDAQPYFRVFNPMKQGREYDPDAEYITTYVPELAAVDPEQIHEWHELSTDERNRLAPSYPGPIVDHAERRELAIERFEQAKNG
ncbi:deoxyribodipyrimidine photo-lyase [Salinadaptatus halalkaliphilus]|uniref:Deoxyribodipyrimidine photo-lyase n=1 Tax=Salinadaptatus halalkaliphilus TaxID=2419781 RepID=A0A4S3TNT2_9EURY|nr:deoxyribodipyrimidine photo-lyase [Salinadaptatus halalkaliphilus]THE64795.1 deoxyribodipyrimidine photo-lyase [Salinadaptatus halalkaliphilus]